MPTTGATIIVGAGATFSTVTGTFPGTYFVPQPGASWATECPVTGKSATGFTISGTVLACADQTCASSQPLAGATVTVMSGSTTVATTAANASGNYSFSNIPMGSYTITASGYDASNTHYMGNLLLTLTGDAPNTTIQALPG